MICTFTEAAKFLGYSSRSQLYKMKDLGYLDDFLEDVEGKLHLNMKPRGKMSLARHIMYNIQWRATNPIRDFDPDVWLKEQAQQAKKLTKLSTAKKR